MINLINDKEFLTCTKCNVTYPATEEYFYKQKYTTKTKGTFYKLTHPCRNCRREEAAKKYHENREEDNERSKLWRQNNKQQYKEIQKRKSKNRKEEDQVIQKEWRKNNKEKTKEYNDRYKEKQFKLKTSEWDGCKEYFNNSCAYCGINELEAKNTQGKNLNKEHAMNKGQNDLSNCLPSCTTCNSSKHMDDYTNWFIPENEVFEQERLNKIHKWLEEDYKLYIKD